MNLCRLYRRLLTHQIYHKHDESTIFWGYFISLCVWKQLGSANESSWKKPITQFYNAWWRALEITLVSIYRWSFFCVSLVDWGRRKDALPIKIRLVLQIVTWQKNRLEAVWKIFWITRQIDNLLAMYARNRSHWTVVLRRVLTQNWFHLHFIFSEHLYMS
jgi:hypothetical protein